MRAQGNERPKIFDTYTFVSDVRALHNKSNTLISQTYPLPLNNLTYRFFQHCMHNCPCLTQQATTQQLVHIAQYLHQSNLLYLKLKHMLLLTAVNSSSGTHVPKTEKVKMDKWMQRRCIDIIIFCIPMFPIQCFPSNEILGFGQYTENTSSNEML